MSYINFNNVSLRYPIYGTDTRSLKRDLLHVSTGGKLGTSESGIHHVDALHNINLHLKEGDRLGLIGHNGAGKSTLLRLALGVYEPTSGSVEISGSVSSLIDISFGVLPNLSGYENIKLRGRLLGLNSKEIEEMIEDVETFSELGQYLALPVKAYSSGMQVRLAFAMSTAINPEILLLDEVIGAGDARFFKKAQDRMSNIITQSKIVILASHSNDVIKDFCNKAVLLEHGKIKALGTPEDVIETYLEKETLVNA